MAKKIQSTAAYVRVEDCRERHDVTVKRVDKIENALFGEDGRGGMVNDIAQIKTKIDAATSFVRTIIIPIAVPLILGMFGYIIGKFGGV